MEGEKRWRKIHLRGMEIISCESPLVSKADFASTERKTSDWILREIAEETLFSMLEGQPLRQDDR